MLSTDQDSFEFAVFSHIVKTVSKNIEFIFQHITPSDKKEFFKNFADHTSPNFDQFIIELVTTSDFYKKHVLDLFVKDNTIIEDFKVNNLIGHMRNEEFAEVLVHRLGTKKAISLICEIE